jgi:hypothetical protein
MTEPPPQIDEDNFPGALRNFYEAVNRPLDEDTSAANIRNFKRCVQKAREDLEQGRDRVRFKWMRGDEDRGVVQESCQYEYRYGTWHRHDFTVL